MAMLNSVLTADAENQFYLDVISGLSRKCRTLPCKYFYDQRGSQLFDQICRLDAYYPTRTEIALLDDYASEIAGCIGRNSALLELGSGSSEKTRKLIDCVGDLAAYVPIEISGEYLDSVVARLEQDYPDLAILPLVADFSRPIDVAWDDFLPPHKRRVAYFPGSTIGNFTPEQSLTLLRSVRQWVGPEGGLVIGVDLQKDVDVLKAAYDDPEQVTAAFNLNLLSRINRELGADFDESAFSHRAIYSSNEHRVEMQLVSQIRQAVSCGDFQFFFNPGDTICTEYSHKYTIDGFSNLAHKSRFEVQQVWTDAQQYFAIFYCHAR